MLLFKSKSKQAHKTEEESKKEFLILVKTQV